MAKGCPGCGCRKYKKARVGGGDTIVQPRVCADCGRTYIIPLPRWIGLIAYLIAAFIVGAMLIDWFAPPRDLPIHFFWKGRFGVLVLAGWLVYSGTQVLQGKTGYED